MQTQNHRVVCFGEVLWDILPTGSVPGGAPMNVAYHLNRQGKNPALITRIGDDKEGKDLVNLFTAAGVCTDFFQVDEDYGTGKVYATPGENNEITYTIVDPVAWDFITWENRFHKLLAEADYFVFGSLAARNGQSRSTLLQLLEIARTKVLDINLRAPFFSREAIVEQMVKADFLKLNEAELKLISGWFFDFTSVPDQLRAIAELFQIENIVVTRGAEGSVFLHERALYEHPGISVQVADTVGSGDAFLAGLLGKLLNKSSPDEALAFANAMGAFVATQRGACPTYTLEQVNRLLQKTNRRATI